MKSDLKLTPEQKVAVLKFKEAYFGLISKGVELVQFDNDCSLFAFNGEPLYSIDVPENAAFENEKVEVTAEDMEEILPYGMLNYHHLDDSKMLVVFEDKD